MKARRPTIATAEKWMSSDDPAKQKDGYLIHNEWMQKQYQEMQKKVKSWEKQKQKYSAVSMDLYNSQLDLMNQFIQKMAESLEKRRQEMLALGLTDDEIQRGYKPK